MAFEDRIAEALNRLISFLSTVGLRSFYFPLLLIFGLFFGLLSKIKVFGGDDKGKKISAVIALMAAFIIMTSPFGTQIAIFFEGFFSRTSVTLIGVLAVILIAALFIDVNAWKGLFKGKDNEGKDVIKPLGYIALIGGLLLAAYLFYNSGGFSLIDRTPFGPPGFPGADDIIFLLVIAGLIGLVWWVMKG